MKRLFFLAGTGLLMSMQAQAIYPYNGPQYPNPNTPYIHPANDQCARLDVVSNGQVLPLIDFQGRTWLEGRHNTEYALMLTNYCSTRVMAIVSVDGLNVLTGKSAGYNQAGYIVDVGSQVTIPGWRKSDRDTAAFYFTYPGDSYGSRVGKAANLGVIGAAFFQERIPDQVIVPQISGGAPGMPPIMPQAAARESGPRFDMQEKHMNRESLGTGYGRNIAAPVVRGEFTKASSAPFVSYSFRYETRERLVRMGALNPQPLYRNNEPSAFPNEGGYVPPPPGR